MDESRNNRGYNMELSDFRSTFLIHCPACLQKSTLTNNVHQGFIRGKIVCSECGFNKELGENSSYAICTVDGQVIESRIVLEKPVGARFSLWCSKNFKGNSLWAFNEQHLKFLYDFIVAKHRERNLQEMKNRSIGSRLPAWMTSAANRSDLTRLIETMF